MQIKPTPAGIADLDSYLQLFVPYRQKLRDFSHREGEYGSRFALLFRQVARLLVLPDGMNQGVPEMFLNVAQRYLANDPETVKYFSYEDNRQAFLCDLLQWIEAHERGRKMV